MYKITTTLLPLALAFGVVTLSSCGTTPNTRLAEKPVSTEEPQRKDGLEKEKADGSDLEKQRIESRAEIEKKLIDAEAYQRKLQVEAQVLERIHKMERHEQLQQEDQQGQEPEQRPGQAPTTQ